MSANKPIIVIILPKQADKFPEKFGGGYVRFELIKPYLLKYVNLLVFYYLNQISIPLVHFLNVIFKVRKIRTSCALVILTVNPSPMDVWIGYLLSLLLKIPHVVFVNAIPLSGFVGYISRRFSRSPTLIEIWEIIKNSNKPLRVKIVETLQFYLLFKSLKKSVIVPLTPDIAYTLKKLEYVLINMPIGVGCTEGPKKVQPKKIWDAAYIASPLHPDKGLYDVIDVWELVVNFIPNARLIIAGKKDPNFNLDFLLDYIKRKNLTKNVTLLAYSWLPRKVVLELIAKSTIFLYPTRKDQTPLVISEALSLGVPVVTYNLPGISFAYGDCPAVVRVELGNKERVATEVIKLLMEQDSLVKQLSQAALDWCITNSWKKIALRTLIACFKAIRLKYTELKMDNKVGHSRNNVEHKTFVIDS